MERSHFLGVGDIFFNFTLFNQVSNRKLLKIRDTMVNPLSPKR